MKAPLDLNQDKLRRLSELRLQESRLLYDAGAYSGCYYLAGYAVECGLKACVASHMRAGDFPDKGAVAAVHTHQADVLVGPARLSTQLAQLIAHDDEFDANWGRVKNWSETSRYRVIDQDVAFDLLKAVADETHGVMQWIRLYW